MQFRLRTLLIVLALGPPLLAGAWFNYVDYRDRQQWKDVGGPGAIATFNGIICNFVVEQEVEGHEELPDEQNATE